MQIINLLRKYFHIDKLFNFFVFLLLPDSSKVPKIWILHRKCSHLSWSLSWLVMARTRPGLEAANTSRMRVNILRPSSSADTLD